MRREWPSKLREYRRKEEILQDRGSYSKTDQDATFMRMKEDHMRNGQLKPAYNVQFSTSDQFVLHYSIHQATTDTTTLIPHLDGFEKAYRTLPEELTADAGYGSEENYLHLEKKQVEAYVKYNTFDITKRTKKWKEKYPFHTKTLHYDQEKDLFICPMGQPMRFAGIRKEKTRTGFEKQVRLYRAVRCEGCPLRGKCHKSKRNRTIQVNFENQRLREKAKRNLESERGIENRKQRPIDVEPVFGHIKNNHNFRRFMLRGIEKVEIETGLLAIAQNMRKIGR